MKLLDLNDDIFLHILTFLNPTDRLALSKTCRQLEELCVCTDSLWRSFTLNLRLDTETRERKVKLTEDEKEILEISGNRIQNMNISLDGSGAIEFDQRPLAIEARKWNLTAFSFCALDIGEPTIARVSEDTCPSTVFSIAESVLDLLYNCLVCLDWTNARNTKLETLSLSIHSWIKPICTHKEVLADILRCVNFYECLKHFSLDCFFSRNLMREFNMFYFSEFDMKPTTNYYSGLIAMFENLQKLEINSFYLTNCLLIALSQSDRIKLQSMTLVLDVFAKERITSWPQLVMSSPSLKVMVEAFYNSSPIYIRYILPACVPVVSWKIYSLPRVGPYKRKKLKNMFNILCLFKETLQTVAVQNGRNLLCQCNLLKMVRKCSKLQTLHLQGRIHSNTILEMASFQRQWLKLGVLGKHIIFPMSWKENRQKNIRRLCAEVSEKLGCEWKLELQDTYKTIFTRPVLI